MKKANFFQVVLFSGLMMAGSGGYAQVDKIAQAGLKWLTIPVGARAAALGSAFTAGTPDASSVFWNPAGLARTDGSHVFLNQTRWIAEINVNAAAVSFKAGNVGTFGVHLMAVDWGNFHGTQFSGDAGLYEETGTFSPSDIAIGVTYARQISDKFAFGGNLKFVHEDLGSGLEGSFAEPTTYSATLNVLAFDFGTTYNTGFKDLRLGMAIVNLSEEKEYRFESFPLPFTFKFGVAMDLAQLFTDGEASHGVTFMADAINPRDFSERMQFGMEYSFKNTVFLRGGYQTNYEEQDVSLGGGLRLGVSNIAFSLDYSYLQFKNFDAVHMFSFDFGF